jgi:hypothetical protein
VLHDQVKDIMKPQRVLFSLSMEKEKKKNKKAKTMLHDRVKDIMKPQRVFFSLKEMKFFTCPTLGIVMFQENLAKLR